MNDFVLNGPLEEIELTDRGLHAVFFVSKGHLDTIPSTERIEPFLGVSLELQFIIHVDLEPRTVVDRICGTVFFGIIGRKPIHNA
jgi:hypothetical protein